MGIFKNKFFERWAKEIEIGDDLLIKAVPEME